MSSSQDLGLRNHRASTTVDVVAIGLIVGAKADNPRGLDTLYAPLYELGAAEKSATSKDRKLATEHAAETGKQTHGQIRLPL